MKIALILVLAAAGALAAPRSHAVVPGTDLGQPSGQETGLDLGQDPAGVRPLAPAADGSRPLRRGAELAPAAAPSGAPQPEALPEAQPDLAQIFREPDLERREQHFAAVVERAAGDAALREALEALARRTDPAGADLAWTARLALRELRARPAPLAPRGGAAPDRELDAPAPLRGWPFGGRDPFDDPFFSQPFLQPGRPGPFPGDVHGELLEEFFGGRDPFARLRTELERLDALLGTPADPQRAPRGGAAFQGRSERLSVTPDGVRLEVEVDGPEGRTSRTYEARTLEELYAAHPELRPVGASGPR